MNEVMIAQNNGVQEIKMEGTNFIADLTQTRIQSYSSLKAETKEEKIAFYNAVNSTEKRIGDVINEFITVKHVYVEVVKCVDKETGEEVECPRTVLIDEEGTSYQAVSKGIFNGLVKAFQIFGTPDVWENPLTFKVKQVTKAEYKILTLELVSDKIIKAKK